MPGAGKGFREPVQSKTLQDQCSRSHTHALVSRVAMSAHRSTPVDRNELGELPGLTLELTFVALDAWLNKGQF